MVIYYSHPGKELYTHLETVNSNSLKIIKDISFQNKNIIEKLVNIISLSHDFGKFTSYFQKFIIHPKAIKKISFDSELKNHGLISALFGFYACKLNEETKNYAFTVYTIIKHHHGNLITLKDDLVHKKDKNNLLKQLNTINSDVFLWYQSKNINVNLSQFNQFIQECDDQQWELFNIGTNSFKQYIGESKDFRLFFLTNMLYSILIDSDKKEASEILNTFNDVRLDLPSELVDKYKQQFNQTSELNVIRDEIYQKVSKKLKSLKLSGKIYSITAPTGTGKTLTSFNFALKLRKRIKDETGKTMRIIYSVPFTSIIDQNFEVLNQVLNQIPEFANSISKYILKHHHLADIKYKENEEEYDEDKALLLIESWESEIIVTTFIQLFHTLIGYKNSFLKKLHNISNSIVILDEIQNVPIKYWNLMRVVLLEFSKEYNVYFILLTATKPLIFEEGDCEELLEDYVYYFTHPLLNRVILYPVLSEEKDDLKKMEMDDFFTLFCNKIDENNNNSYMVVLNTIKSVTDIYKKIKNKYSEDYELIYLSTSLVPKVRKQRIESIKRLTEEKRKLIVVTTQLIEAGVDIDLDVIFRDIAPFDSIIQVCGRCNRNNSKERGEVYIINLLDKRKSGYTKEFSKYIYDSILIEEISKKMLTREIEEKDFLNNINSAFLNIKKIKRQDEGIINGVKYLHYRDLDNSEDNDVKQISSFKLIDDNYPNVDCFIELDEEASQLLKKYKQLPTSSLEKRKEYLKIKKEFAEYIISINQKYVESLNPENKGFVIICKELIKPYYDEETGFIKEMDNNCFII